MSDAFVAVALPLPVQTTFTYHLPDGARAERGARVEVPFGVRRVIGVVTGPAAPPEGITLKDVIEVVDEAPLVDPPLLDLADWMADYYLAPPGECFRLILPPAGVRASRAVVRLAQPAAASGGDPVLAALAAGPLPVSTLAHRLKRDPSARLLKLRREGLVALEQDLDAPGFRHRRLARLTGTPAAPRGPAQAAILERLGAEGRVPVPDLVRDQPSWRGALARLVRAGAVAIDEEREVRGPDVLPGGHHGRPEATADQVGALEALEAGAADGGYRPFLLHGVTGSGKTEVYFRAVESALARGRGALILVPEIALTPMLVRAAVGRFGETVAVLHSDLAMGERHDQWWRIREGEARVVVGARSAVFAPVPALGAAGGGRGARGRLQAGGEPALPRARRGGDAGQAGRRVGGAGLGHAVARVPRQRAQGQVPAAGAAVRGWAPRACPPSPSWTGARC